MHVDSGIDTFNFEQDFNQLLTQPAINIGNVPNFYAFYSDLSEELNPNQSNVFVPVTSKSSRRSIKRKLKKIVRQAHRVYDQMLEDDFPLVDDHYEVQM